MDALHAREPVPLTWLFNFIKPYAVRVSSTSGGEHVSGSYHYLHRAVDVVGPAESLMRLHRAAIAAAPHFREAFYDPAHRYVKNGHVVQGQIGGHSDHVHLAR